LCQERLYGSSAAYDRTGCRNGYAQPHLGFLVPCVAISACDAVRLKKRLQSNQLQPLLTVSLIAADEAPRANQFQPDVFGSGLQVLV
jgi:hypothetical protein